MHLIRAMMNLRKLALMFLLPLANLAGEDFDPAREQARRQNLDHYFRGRYVYESQCVPCHGKSGRGDGPWAQDFTDKPRNFRSGIFKFRTTPYGKLPVSGDLRRTIRNGISGTAMPMFQKLSDEEVDGLIVYLQNLSRRWNDRELYAPPLPLPEKVPGWFSQQDERRRHEASGAARYAQVCAACHGAQGKGDGPGGKGLRDAWGHPIVPADLTRPHHKSGDSPRDLFRTIAAGLDGTPMIGYHGTFPDEEIWNLVAFIQSIEIEAKD